MKRFTELAIVILGLILLYPSVILGQDKYPKSLPEVVLSQVRQSSTVPEHDMQYDSLVGDIINLTHLDSLVAYVGILTGEDSIWINGSKVRIQNRQSNPGNDLAADYIMNKLDSYGLEVYDQIYSEEGRNIYAVQPGILYPEKEYIICAHYDAVADYCADDNASGAAAVLEAARLLSQFNLKHTLVYALWDQEEIGLIGSRYYASGAKADQKEILGVLNLDMIGWDSDGDRLVDIHSSDVASSDSLANALLVNNSLYGLNLDPVIYNPGTRASDHSAFWDNGYGAVLLIEAYYGDDLNPYYHSENDRIDSFDLSYFHDLSKLAIGSMSSLVEFVEDTLIVAAGPASGYQNYTTEITVKGVYTSFLDTKETLNVWLSNGTERINADSVEAQSNTSLTAFFNIPLEASTGMWDVNVQTTDNGLLRAESSFEVLPSPPIISFSPDTLRISIESGTSKVCPLTIKNIGANILNFNIIGVNQNSALQFDGIDDQVLVGYDSILDILGDITISVWYKTNSPQWGVLVANYDQFMPDHGYELCSSSLYDEGGFIYFECASDDSRDGFSTDATYNDGEWHFVTAIYTPDGSSRGRVFVDAIEQTGYYLGWDNPIPAIGATPLYPLMFGTLSEPGPGDPAYFEGTLDEVRIWDKALTQEEIQANMYNNLNGSEEGLIGYWNFNEPGIDSAIDLTANGNHGILEGGVKRVPDGAPLDIEWLSIESDTGSCLAQSSVHIELLFDAGDLDEGEYLSQIIIFSDDPFNPIVKIPVILSVSQATGTEETLDNDGLSLYPNPVIDVLHIESQYSGEHSVEIFSLNCKLLFKQVMEETPNQLDLSSYQSGVYFITISSKEFVTTKKIIKY